MPPVPPSPTVTRAPLACNPPNAAIVAVMDDGLAFANQRFCDAAGNTRFKYFWNQDDTTGINPPPGFGWGREFRQGEINTLLTACMPLDTGCAALLSCIGAHRVGNRPDRVEPRRIKRRPKHFKLMQQPRAEYKKRLR